MATTIKLSYKGQWIPIPNNPQEAEQMGWHEGADYSTDSWFNEDSRYNQIYTWCQSTVDPHHFRFFANSVWFLKPQDAIMCQLRWT